MSIKRLSVGTIGNPSPAQFYSLFVTGSGTSGGNENPAFYLSAAAGHGSNGTGWDYSIYAERGVFSPLGFATGSDVRIKNIVGMSEGNRDLDQLRKIEISNYRFKDNIKNDDDIIKKKVIAQQVESVYPQAVNLATDVIPDIFTKATMDASGMIDLKTDLKVGERVKLIFDNIQDVYEVSEVVENGFTVAGIEELFNSGEDVEVFVYGREVDDFRTFDYDAISMLNVSATREPARQNDELKMENDRLKTQLDALQDRVENIEALLVK